MRTTTKVLGIGLASASMLLGACELPGSGAPPELIVFPNPGVAPTGFSGFPATFQGINVQPEVPNEPADFRAFDVFATTDYDGPTLTISCEVGGAETYVYISDYSGLVLGDDCDTIGDGVEISPLENITIEIGVTNDASPGPHPYKVHVALAEH